MAYYLDILLDDSEDLQATADGDFKQGNAVNQLIYYILKSGTGNWKEFPLVGVGIEQYLNSNIDRYELQAIIKAQLKSDVFDRVQVDTSLFPGVIYINNVPYETV